MRNAEANGVELEVRLLDATAEGMPTAEIALANLDLPTLAQLSTPSALRTLVTSGYYESDRPAFADFAHAARRTEGGWTADLFRRQ